MRKDIQINTQTGDFVFNEQDSLALYPFEWISEGDLTLMGQVTLPANYDIDKLSTLGVNILIPYTPIYKPIQLRIVRDFGENSRRALINPLNNTEWFDVYTKLYGADLMKICASQLFMIHFERYVVQLNESMVYLWAQSATDMQNVDANFQNRNLLLKCVPSNCYRYPLSGVGLVRYLHSSLNRSGLADKLQSEFKADKVTVRNAAFNPYTSDLELDLDFTEANAGI